MLKLQLSSLPVRLHGMSAWCAQPARFFPGPMYCAKVSSKIRVGLDCVALHHQVQMNCIRIFPPRTLSVLDTPTITRLSGRLNVAPNNLRHFESSCTDPHETDSKRTRKTTSTAQKHTHTHTEEFWQTFEQDGDQAKYIHNKYNLPVGTKQRHSPEKPNNVRLITSLNVN